MRAKGQLCSCLAGRTKYLPDQRRMTMIAIRSSRIAISQPKTSRGKERGLARTPVQAETGAEEQLEREPPM